VLRKLPRRLSSGEGRLSRLLRRGEPVFVKPGSLRQKHHHSVMTLTSRAAMFAE
jgi:hypothetical protein